MPTEPPCIVRLPSLAAAVEQAADWSACAAGAVLVPVPWRGGRWPGAPRDADAAQDGSSSLAEQLGQAAARLRRAGLACYLELGLDRVAADAVPATARPEWLRPQEADPALDPRLPRMALHTRELRATPPEAFIEAWRERLAAWVAQGVAGFAFTSPARLSPCVWRALLAGLRAAQPGARAIAWTPGMTPDEVAARREAGFDWTVSSLAWWDGRADWLAEEDARLRELAPVLAYAGTRHDARWLWTAALAGDGLVFDGQAQARAQLPAVQAWRRRTALRGGLRVVGGQAGRATVLLRGREPAGTVMLALAPEGQAALDTGDLAGLLPAGPPALREVPAGLRPRGQALPEAGCALLCWPGAPPVTACVAAPWPKPGRIVIERVTPAVPDGAVKRIVHEAIQVEADVFIDGHDALAVDVCWRACDQAEWQRQPMQPLGNDRWRAEWRAARIGAHEYQVQAWVDVWATWCQELQAKFEAGQDVRLSLREAAQWLAGVLDNDAPASARRALAALEQSLDQGLSARLLGQLRAPGAWLRGAGTRPFLGACPPLPLRVDRAAARYGSWYELFPRSQSAAGHGRFDDVIARLPDIRAMGFDVLYLTPIHPIGHTRRKGRNNSLQAEAGDVGSPYAIGSAEGGHDAIAPELGSLADFERLVDAARGHGLELALDFAIQCSPDHPWLREHPEWFSWRADGSLRHAENPPKKYEDIVNVAFYDGARRRMGLWRALRDIVLFWAGRGVRIFRVDNPHTKPLPFWQWLIAEVHARAPDVIFLSEAFTRPAMMYRLAKAGFTQSYTYFTWRNGKAEIEAYLAELSRPPVADFFRPHFFVNTPDINPYYLQNHGRPGFLVRAALAATASGLWGIYSGFELCEARALPGREEYADSEKYQLRPRDWLAPGNLRAEIGRLNAIRRANPALQSHRGYRALPAGPEPVLAYLRQADGASNLVLVMINLDPGRALLASARLDAPGHGENQLTGAHEHWPEGVVRAWLSPESPYGIWRLPAAPLPASPI